MQSQDLPWEGRTHDVLITGWSGVFSGLNNDFFLVPFFPKIIPLSKYYIKKNLFLTIDLSSQVDHTSIQFVSQNWLVLLFKIIKKKFYQKFFTIVKPLFYLELRGKIVRLPANLCQIVIKVK